MIRILNILLLIALIHCRIWSQTSNYSLYFFDNITKKPNKDVLVSRPLDETLGVSNNYGNVIFKTNKNIISLEVSHGNYELTTIELNENDTFYLNRQVFTIGQLNFYNPNLPQDIECAKLNKLSDYECKNITNIHPTFNKGWICFDKYVYDQIFLSDVYKIIDKKRVEVIFNVNARGEIDSVSIQTNISYDCKKTLENIFMNSPLWGPLCYYNNYYESLCRYFIKFKE